MAISLDERLRTIQDTLSSSISDISATNEQMRSAIYDVSYNLDHLSTNLLITNILLAIIAITFIAYVILQFMKFKRNSS